MQLNIFFGISIAHFTFSNGYALVQEQGRNNQSLDVANKQVLLTDQLKTDQNPNSTPQHGNQWMNHENPDQKVYNTENIVKKTDLNEHEDGFLENRTSQDNLQEKNVNKYPKQNNISPAENMNETKHPNTNTQNSLNYQRDNILNNQHQKQNMKQNKYENVKNESGKSVPVKTNYRKSFNSPYKRYKVRQRSEAAYNQKRAWDNAAKSEPSFLETILFAVDTGPKRKPEYGNAKRQEDPMDRIEKIIKNWFVNTNKPDSAFFRAQKEYNIKPSYIRFRKSANPSLKLEITSSSIIKALGSFLKTPIARRYADVAGKQAALAYDALSAQVPELRKSMPLNQGAQEYRLDPGYDTSRSMYRQ